MLPNQILSQEKETERQRERERERERDTLKQKQIILNTYSIKSTLEFIQILNSPPPNKFIMASRDVKTIFTNAPVKESINIIVKKTSIITYTTKIREKILQTVP